ncbi:hypothetical protein HY478_01260 [Candidatus Uhrbacteria bacterium]|nr:hypothetical protein [Candidatus Uhrbacteria bacterium]
MKTDISHAIRTYFDATWELWKREVDRALWDWAVDGPFCTDTVCGQRMRLARESLREWRCIRCGRASTLPKLDLATLRDRVIQSFEEEARTYEASGLPWRPLKGPTTPGQFR